MYVIAKSPKRIVIKFHALELRPYLINGHTYEVGKGKAKKLFVNITIPWLTWTSHGKECAGEVLEALRVVAQWQGKLQDKQPRLNSHAHKPTIDQTNGHYRKLRYPVYFDRDEPYVQFERGEEETRWDVGGMFIQDNLPAIGLLFSALQKLDSEV